jgi:hypothetical protein
MSQITFNFILILLVVIIIVIHMFAYYIQIMYKNKMIQFLKNRFLLLSINNRLFQLSLSTGAVVPYGDALTEEDFIYEAPSTVVELTDAELNELLQIVFAEIGDSNLISVELLQSLGLYTDTVVSVLTALGYLIF